MRMSNVLPDCWDVLLFWMSGHEDCLSYIHPTHCSSSAKAVTFAVTAMAKEFHDHNVLVESVTTKTARSNSPFILQSMNWTDILVMIDAEIAHLQQARTILAPITNPAKTIDTSEDASEKAGPVARKRKKRKMSPEGRARIAEGTKRRWAAQKAKSYRGSVQVTVPKLNITSS